MPLYLLVDEFVGFERGLRVVAVIEELLNNSRSSGAMFLSLQGCSNPRDLSLAAENWCARRVTCSKRPSSLGIDQGLSDALEDVIVGFLIAIGHHPEKEGSDGSVQHNVADDRFCEVGWYF